MKSSKQILSLLTHQPQFGSLTQHTCYQKFMALLPPRFQKAIAFIYIKNDTLFIALSHPGYKMELNYNKELFKELLATLGTHTPECKKYTAGSVVFFNAKYHSIQERPDEDTVPYYQELSSGTFEVTSDNEALKKKFLHTKTLIRKHQDHTTE